MNLDSKIIIQGAVRSYLEDESPEELEEFDIVFEDVYETIERRISEKQNQKDENQGEGLAFDSNIVFGTTISVACWASAILVKAVVKDYAKHDLPRIFDKIEPKLAAWFNNPELIIALRVRIERIIRGQ